jgi:hypothetical protein
MASLMYDAEPALVDITWNAFCSSWLPCSAGESRGWEYQSTV